MINLLGDMILVLNFKQEFPQIISFLPLGIMNVFIHPADVEIFPWMSKNVHLLITVQRSKSGDNRSH